MSDVFRKVVQAYQQGRFADAVRLSDAISGKAGQLEGKLQALRGNSLFKLGEKLAAADAFVSAARLSAGDAPGLFKLALTLYLQVGAVAKVVEIAAETVRLNPAERDLAYRAARAFFGNGLRGDPTPLFAFLDKADNHHLALIVNYFRLKGETKELQAELAALVDERPDNAFLRATWFTVARENGDFAVMELQERFMATPDGRALLDQEAAHARLLWCEDEALLASPSSDSVNSALMPRPDARRPFSAAGERVRIGYLSNDFTEHATMTLFQESMALHDPERFDVTLFSYTEQRGVARREHWPTQISSALIDVSDMNDTDVARLISERQIDILVDLKGHTMGARAGIVNCSDAPLKVTYLGYPGSVRGVDLDYQITDAIVTPDSSRPNFAEKLCRLPGSYQSNNSATRPRPQPMTRAEAGLPEDAFVFASFNAARKITPRTVRLWSAILRGTPQSVLWVMCTSAEFRANLLSAFEAEGVAPERIIFCGHMPYADHISRVALANLGLDTFPCNGHTTTSDMLWAGLPLLSTVGTAFHSRVSASLLSAMGVPELACESDEAFVQEGIRLAHDTVALASLREKIENGRETAPLFDTARFTRNLERAYEMMAERARNGLEPDHFDVPEVSGPTG